MSLSSIPTTLAEANAFVGEFHRHHEAVVGHRWSLGVQRSGTLVGVAIVGRPVGPKTPQYTTAEVTRLCTDGSKNACSFLYGASARIAKEFGYHRIQTFILPTESGVSLKAAGWVFDGVCHSSGQVFKNRPGRKDDPHPPKHRWIKQLRPTP